MCTVGGVKLRVDVSRKEGTDHYGSIGASVGVEVEMHGATAADIQGARDYWQSWCAEAVDRAIAAQRTAPPIAVSAPTAAASPAPTPPLGPTGKPRSEWGTAYPSAGAPMTPAAPPPPANGQRRGGGGGNHDGPPRSGGGLYARLKGMDEINPKLGIVKHVSAWAKAGGNEARFSDWSPGWVEAGWAEAERYIEALRESERLQSGH